MMHTSCGGTILIVEASFEGGAIFVWEAQFALNLHGGGISMKQSIMRRWRRIFRRGGEIGGGFKILEAEFFRGAFGVIVLN